MSSAKYLKEHGLLNADTEDLGVIAMGQRTAPVAYCSSPKCAGHYTNFRSVRKDVVGHPTNCPDCGYVLRWGKMKYEHTAIRPYDRF